MPQSAIWSGIIEPSFTTQHNIDKAISISMPGEEAVIVILDA